MTSKIAKLKIVKSRSDPDMPNKSWRRVYLNGVDITPSVIEVIYTARTGDVPTVGLLLYGNVDTEFEDGD